MDPQLSQNCHELLLICFFFSLLSKELQEGHQSNLDFFFFGEFNMEFVLLNSRLHFKIFPLVFQSNAGVPWSAGVQAGISI